MAANRDLEVRLDDELPRRLGVGRGTAIFVRGAAASSGGRLRQLSIEVDGDTRAAMAHSMPADGTRDAFWGIVPIGPPARPVGLRIVAETRSGGRAGTDLGSIELEAGVPGAPAAPRPTTPGPGHLVAIAMATYDPDPALFERQIASLVEQTHANWVCVISDDGSAPERLAQIERAVAGDQRFALSHSDRRLGFYANFERALAMVPDEASHVALADQDDRWHPDKLEALLDGIGGAQLAYSDARATRPDGEVISHSLWDGRRNNRDNLASLLLSNTVTGAASLFRRELLDAALPFPPAPGTPYHDHWIALVALASGELAYVDRPLLDYVQHPAAVLGSDAIRGAAGPGVGQRARRLGRDPSGALERWREAYFDEYCRVLVMGRVLEMRCGDRLDAPKRRALRRAIAGERSPGTLAWLALRPLRRLAGRNETLGFEHRLLRGIAWRYLARPAARLRS